MVITRDTARSRVLNHNAATLGKEDFLGSIGGKPEMPGHNIPRDGNLSIASDTECCK
jgi:hypothetical protein